MADDDRPHPLLAIATHVKKRAALRREHPLVTVADGVGRADRGEVDIDHARRMRAVDERLDPAVVERGHDLGNRQHERRRAGDVIQHDEPRSRADGREHGVARSLGSDAPKWDARGHQTGARGIGRRLKRVAGRGVGVVEQDDLVAGFEPQAACDDVDARRRVRDEGKIIRVGTKEPSKRGTSVVERRLEVVGEERDGLALHPRAPRVLGFEHGARGRAERPMVQEGHGGVERPVDGELGGHRLGIVRPMPDPERPDAILFDLDGTLVDTVGARIDAWEAAFAERGLAVARTRLEPMIGMDGRRLAAEVTGDEGSAEEVDKRAGELFDERNRDPRPLPGAREVLERLDAHGVIWAIATSSRAEQVAASVRSLGLAHEPRIVDGSAVKRAKPAPDLLLLAADRLGVRPDATWYVGDSTWDMRAATAAGMHPIAVSAGAAVGAAELRDAGAAIVIGTLDELELPG